MDAYQRLARAKIIQSVRDLTDRNRFTRQDASDWLRSDDADLFFYSCELDRDRCLDILRRRGIYKGAA